jgi:chromosome partitioning protein
MTALAVRGDRKPVLACAGYTDGRLLLEQVKKQKGSFDDIVIDAGGRDTATLRAAVVLCDALLVPFQPRSFDVWTLEAVTDLILEASAVRDPVRALAVLNMADALGHDNDEAVQAIVEAPGIEVCEAVIHRRKAFANAAGEGLSVLERKPPDPKAVSELEALVGAVFNSKVSS